MRPGPGPSERATARSASRSRRAFVDAETSALARGDLDGAVEANLSWWIDGPGRGAADLSVREPVRRMQRRAFEVTARRVADGIAGAQLAVWPGVAHLPSMERPDDFVTLLLHS